MTSTILARQIAGGLIFGEGTRWVGDEMVLSDMIGGKVLRATMAGQLETLLDLPEQPNGLVVLEDGALPILSMFDRKILKRTADGMVSTFCDLADLTTGYLGDVVRTAEGRLYVDDVGARVLHGEPPSPIGRLILVEPDGSARVILRDLAFPNGVVISPDGKTLYLGESMTHSVDAFDITDNGNLTNRRRLATFDCQVDGMSIDDEGGVWPCLPDQQEVVRVNAAGEITHRVSTPGHKPIACAIGGPGARTICIAATALFGEGKSILDEMVAKRLHSSLWLAETPFANTAGRP